MKSTACKLSSASCSAMNGFHGWSFAALVGRLSAAVSLPPELANRKPRPTSAADGLQTSQFPAQTPPHGQALLGFPTSLRACVEEDSDGRFAGHGCALAPCWISAVMAAPLPRA